MINDDCRGCRYFDELPPIKRTDDFIGYCFKKDWLLVDCVIKFGECHEYTPKEGD